MERPITHNEVPEAIAYLISKVGALEVKLDKMIRKSSENEEEVKWLNVAELCEYLPSHPREQTVYSWTCSRKIPFHKKGRSIMFDKKEIDEWLHNSSHYKSELELQDEAIRFVKNKRAQ